MRFFEQLQTTHVICCILFVFKDIYVGAYVFTEYFLKVLRKFSYDFHSAVHVAVLPKAQQLLLLTTIHIRIVVQLLFLTVAAT